MKIKITSPLPVEERIRPTLGGIYDVTETENRKGAGELYFIQSNGERVGVFARECEVVPEVES